MTVIIIIIKQCFDGHPRNNNLSKWSSLGNNNSESVFWHQSNLSIIAEILTMTLWPHSKSETFSLKISLIFFTPTSISIFLFVIFQVSSRNYNSQKINLLKAFFSVRVFTCTLLSEWINTTWWKKTNISACVTVQVFHTNETCLPIHNIDNKIFPNTWIHYFACKIFFFFFQVDVRFAMNSCCLCTREPRIAYSVIYNPSFAL